MFDDLCPHDVMILSSWFPSVCPHGPHDIVIVSEVSDDTAPEKHG